MNVGLVTRRLAQPAIERRLPIPKLRPRMAVGLTLVLGIIAIALISDLIVPYRPTAYSAQPLAPPNWQHWLGANDVGQDLFSQLLAGARASVLVGLGAGVISTAIAWGLGLASGLNRAADRAVTGVADLMLALPQLPLVILVAAYLGSSLGVVILVLGAVTWGPFARVIRGQVQAELREPYIEAARSVGGTPWRTLRRHVLPATVPTAVAKFVMTVQYAVVAQASLAFLGLGDPSVVSWGGIVHRAAVSPLIFLNGSWLWWLLPPALAIALFTLGFALVGWSIEERSLPALLRIRLLGEADAH